MDLSKEGGRTKSTSEEKIAVRVAEAREERKLENSSFLQGVVGIIIGVGIALLGVYVGDEKFHDYAIHGGVILGFFGAWRMFFGRDW